MHFYRLRYFFLSGTTVNDCVFRRCSTITHGSSTFTSNAIISSASSIALTTTNPTNISGCTFTSAGTGNAIEITAAGTYSFTNNSFSGYGGTPGDNLTPNSGDANAAIYNNSGGLVTLNVSGGTTPAVRNGAGATTDIVTSAIIRFTGLQTGSEVRVYRGTDPATSIEIGGVESSGTSFEFTQGFSGQTGYYVIHALGFISIYQPITFSSALAEIPVVQTKDRQYDNPA